LHLPAILQINADGRFFLDLHSFVKVGELKIAQANAQHPGIFLKI
jgi:hypothetical protein